MLVCLEPAARYKSAFRKRSPVLPKSSVRGHQTYPISLTSET